MIGSCTSLITATLLAHCAALNIWSSWWLSCKGINFHSQLNWGKQWTKNFSIEQKIICYQGSECFLKDHGYCFKSLSVRLGHVRGWCNSSYLHDSGTPSFQGCFKPVSYSTFTRAEVIDKSVCPYSWLEKTIKCTIKKLDSRGTIVTLSPLGEHQTSSCLTG